MRQRCVAISFVIAKWTQYYRPPESIHKACLRRNNFAYLYYTLKKLADQIVPIVTHFLHVAQLHHFAEPTPTQWMTHTADNGASLLGLSLTQSPEFSARLQLRLSPQFRARYEWHWIAESPFVYVPHSRRTLISMENLTQACCTQQIIFIVPLCPSTVTTCKVDFISMLHHNYDVRSGVAWCLRNLP
jgi:hypothetical protein